MQVNKGGPNVLEESCNEKRSLFLCYPDDFEGETESLGLRCLHAYEGDVVRGFSFDGFRLVPVAIGFEQVLCNFDAVWHYSELP